MEDIKKNVRAHLNKAGEANAKQIAKATGHSETEVINALNAMRVYAEVECEQKGRGKGMTYWLAETCGPVVKKSDNKAAVAAISAGVVANGNDQTGSIFGSVPDATKKLREQNANLQRELSDCRAVLGMARASLGIDEGTSIAQAIEKMKACRDAHVAAAIEWETTMMHLVGEDGIGDVKAAIEKLKADLGHARIQVSALNEQLMSGEEAIDIKDAAKGYLVCAPKRKPARLARAESAVARAKSAAKSAGRSEVFALVPVGVATRKQVLAVEFKERAA